MNRAIFYQETDNFFNWVSNLDLTGNLLHQWASNGNWRLPGDRGNIWQCQTLYDAYNNYYWGSDCPITRQRICNYQQTEQCINNLRETLVNAINTNNHDECLRACNLILRWGGVEHRNRICTVIRNEVESNMLPAYLQVARDMINNITDTDNCPNAVTINGNQFPLQIDSGSTKIFSLISNNFVIYDSRVAAALGHLVRTWHQNTGAIVPNILLFAAATNERRRNPSVNTNLAFPNINAVQRLPHNIAASWLCERFLQLASFQQAQLPAPNLRQVEAALFMMGYSIN